MIPFERRDRALVAELVRREFAGRYRGSVGGLAWSFVQPLFLIAVYTLAFGVILKASGGFPGGPPEYALRVFAGLIVFNAFAEVLARAPMLVAGNPQFVRKVVFPLELLPWVLAIAATLHALVATAVWFAGHAVLFGLPGPGALAFPLVIVAFFPLLLAAGWLLAAFGVLARDTAPLAALASHALLFATPVFYGLEAAPQWLRGVLLANPLAFPVESLRATLFGAWPSALALALFFALASAFAAACLALFRRLRPAFGDFV